MGEGSVPVGTVQDVRGYRRFLNIPFYIKYIYQNSRYKSYQKMTLSQFSLKVLLVRVIADSNCSRCVWRYACRFPCPLALKAQTLSKWSGSRGRAISHAMYWVRLSTGLYRDGSRARWWPSLGILFISIVTENMWFLMFPVCYEEIEWLQILSEEVLGGGEGTSTKKDFGKFIFCWKKNCELTYNPSTVKKNN